MAKKNVCVWLEEELISEMDEHIKEHLYASRSHFMKTLVQRELAKEEK